MIVGVQLTNPNAHLELEQRELMPFIDFCLKCHDKRFSRVINNQSSFISIGNAKE